jgi:hypothetical protein
VERVSDAQVELSFCGSALLQRSRLFASCSDFVMSIEKGE